MLNDVSADADLYSNVYDYTSIDDSVFTATFEKCRSETGDALKVFTHDSIKLIKFAIVKERSRLADKHHKQSDLLNGPIELLNATKDDDLSQSWLFDFK